MSSQGSLEDSKSQGQSIRKEVRDIKHFYKPGLGKDACKQGYGRIDTHSTLKMVVERVNSSNQKCLVLVLGLIGLIGQHLSINGPTYPHYYDERILSAILRT